MIYQIPETGQIWKHKESGSEYVIKTVTNLHATKPGWDRQVVYFDDLSHDWSRPLIEFVDKFERVS